MGIEFNELDEINDKLVYIGDSPSEFKDAIIGLSNDNNHIIYSFDKLVHELIKKNPDFTWESATEWVEYNTIRALPYYGEYAPIVMYEVWNIES